jgi:hypothetical protein
MNFESSSAPACHLLIAEIAQLIACNHLKAATKGISRLFFPPAFGLLRFYTLSEPKAGIGAYG